MFFRAADVGSEEMRDIWALANAFNEQYQIKSWIIHFDACIFIYYSNNLHNSHCNLELQLFNYIQPYQISIIPNTQFKY